MKKYDSLHIIYISVASVVMLVVVLISVVAIIFKMRYRKIKGNVCKLTFHFVVVNVIFCLKFSSSFNCNSFIELFSESLYFIEIMLYLTYLIN